MHGTVKILIVINCTLLAMYNAAVILLRTHERMDKAILGVGLHCDGDSIRNHCDVFGHSTLAHKGLLLLESLDALLHFMSA